VHHAVADHFARHLGLITTRAASQLGVDRRALVRMVGRGELARVHHGVYRHVAAPVTRAQSLLAATLAVGDGAMVSHRAALAHHGVGNFVCSLIEVLSPTGTAQRRPGLIVHRSITVTAGHLHLVDGVPVTTRARTLVDAAAVMSPALVARYAHTWIADRSVSVEAVLGEIERAGNHRGAQALARELDVSGSLADSVPERELGRILQRAGIAPVHHVIVTTSHGFTFELDWAYPDARLGLEMDGYGVHLRSVNAFDDDRFRRNELEIAGWTILNFTARQCRRPSRVVDQVRRALASSAKSAPSRHW
jgi:hypothetical protein